MTYYILLIFLLLDYVRPTSYVPALLPLHLSLLAMIGMVAGSAFGKSRVENSAILGEANSKLLLIFLALLALSVMTAPVTLYSTNTFRAVFEYVLLYWVVTRQVTSVARLKGVVWVLIVAHIAVVALTPELLTSPERQNTSAGGFLGDANDFALSINITIPLCLFLLFESKARSRLMYVGLLLFLVLSVVATQSRGGTLALICVAFYYWLKSDRKVLTAATAAAAVVLVLVLAPPTYFQRMDDIVNTQEGSAGGRIAAWGGGTRMALDNPLLGVGAGHFATAYGTTYRKSLEVPWQTAHSIYFLVLGELGFPGLVLVLVIIGKNFLDNRRLVKEVKARGGEHAVRDRRLLNSLSAALLAFATGGAFLSAIYYPHVFLIAGLSAAVRRIIREGHQSPATQPSTDDGRSRITYHWALRPNPGGVVARRSV